MKVLITGGSGLVGSALIETLASQYEVHCTSRHPSLCKKGQFHAANLLDGVALESLKDIHPDYVIHAAAETNVDKCEDSPEETQKLHVDATFALRRLFPAAKFAYLSTDYVFDGRDGPYTEKSITNPLGVYARTKFAGEAAMTPDDLIVRTTIVFGHHARQNFVNWLDQSLSSGKPVKIVNDQWGSPTYAKDLARAIAHLIPEKQGIYNVVGPEVISRYDFAQRVAETLCLDNSLITPVTSAGFIQKAPRPMHAGLRIDKLLQLGFVMPSLEDSLEDYWLEKMGIGVVSHKKMLTKDTSGNLNGYLRELVSPRDGFSLHPDAQVYLTVADSGTVKGWHTHAVKTGHFNVVSGRAQLVLGDGKKFRSFILDGEGADSFAVKISPGVKTAIKSLGDKPAFIINYSTPDFRQNNKEMTTEALETYPFNWAT